ncbi:MAG TPA: ABC transporter permease [Verrucomicrobiota bacterium]|jgi:putative ABC transport system permease protein|nr:ABC transporter permease [Verrucomicrobiota bacterium]HRT55737.1 ABC transporter permease [Candidatus Paceibacterota bacterium]
MKFAFLIWSNLRRKKLRTALTFLSIAVAFVLFGFLSAIRHALTGGVSLEGADRLVVRHKVSIIQLLPVSYQQRMLQIPGVAAAAHLTWFGGTYQDPKNLFMQAPVVPEEFLDMYPEILLPAEAKKAWLATRTGAIVGRKSAERYGWKIGDRVPIQTSIWAKSDGSYTWEFDIVGIFDGKNQNTDTTPLYFRYDYFDESRQEMVRGLVGWYSIRVKDPAQAAGVARRVDQEFQNSPAETKTEPEGAFVQGFVNQIGNITLITAAILAAVFFTILIVTGNTMAQAVRERTGELGVLKAVGFASSQVLLLVLAESCLLAVLGGLSGLGLARLLTAGGDPTGGMLPLFHFPTRDLLAGVGLSVGLGVVTGIFPALQAMRLRVADALRRM